MVRGDGLDGAYRALAAAILWRAALDVQRGTLFADEARVFLLCEGAADLAEALGLDRFLLARWVKQYDREPRMVGGLTADQMRAKVLELHQAGQARWAIVRRIAGRKDLALWTYVDQIIWLEEKRKAA